MPTRQQTHIDRALTNISLAYAQDASVFIADKVFPIIPVQKQSDLYFTYRKEDFFRDDAKERAKGTESAGGTFDIDHSLPYFCRRYAYHEDVYEEDVINADEPLRLRQDATENVMHKILLKKENLWAQNFFKSGVWGTEITGVASAPTAGQTLKFNLDTSDPIRILNKASVQMCETTGKKPNTLVLSPYVYDALKNHPDIIDRIKYTQKGIVTNDLLATLFEVDRVLVAWAIKSSTTKGATPTNTDMSFIMGKHALLCYSEPSPGLKKASAGYTFAWKGYMGANAMGNRIVRFPVDNLGMGTERVEGEMMFDHRVIAKDLGILLKDIVD